MTFDAQRFYELLPAIHRIRDTEAAGADTEQRGPLQELIAVIAEQAAVLEENLAQLYDDQFIETCADWATPYIGGLIGYRSLHGVAPRISSPRAGHIEIRAGNGHRPTVVLSQALQLRGGADSELTLNGLVLVGAGVTIPASDDGLGLRRVTLRHCTLVSGLELAINGEPLYPNDPSLIVEHETVTVVIDHCAIGAVRTTPVTKVEVSDSIIDATDPAHIAFASVTDAENESGGELTIENSTVIGRVFAASLPLVSNTIFHASAQDAAPVRSIRKQIGCVRFSYLPRGSQVPRRYRCQPDLAIQEAITAMEKKQAGALTDAQRESITNGVYSRVQPAFTSLRYGSPAYCQLRQLTPSEIRTGADDESEMGVFHQVHQPQRETNLHVRFDEYLRFGLEAGIFYET